MTGATGKDHIDAQISMLDSSLISVYASDPTCKVVVYLTPIQARELARDLTQLAELAAMAPVPGPGGPVV